jgi:hypothetical protein
MAAFQGVLATFIAWKANAYLEVISTLRRGNQLIDNEYSQIHKERDKIHVGNSCVIITLSLG